MSKHPATLGECVIVEVDAEPVVVLLQCEGWCDSCRGMELVTRWTDGKALCEKCRPLPTAVRVPADKLGAGDELLTRLARHAKESALALLPPGVEITVVLSRGDGNGGTFVSASSTLPDEHAVADLDVAMSGLRG